ncbi:RpiB/LacA/LacB family sugar-phosphate isomerase [Candidatus Peregrinibacteria bacterium]|nr:RpiB/LacA/LacB family sugar-phosphate isomerase [bacterium]NCQ56101.1 RpiB/LacA/LacB family sugar-phosphate isomerase [Candidatus Parcubacteria bacterium]NCS67927.1 RpiB/LacA/LacB family sugar-phosphate isomerase [Candidatus Peregrinibacteria bacterium]
MTKIYLGSDHGGYKLKQTVREFLEEKNYTVEDLGCDGEDSCDYPEFGKEVAEKVVQNEGSLGIILCGSGIGISIAANRVSGARCALANSTELAELGRQHNGANILAIGARTQFMDDPLDIVETFLNTEVDMSDRHQRRRDQLG